jgi:peroxiredoxin Q/BCP
MTKAPDFCLHDQDNKKHCLKNYQGQWVLIYFYPKDQTPGCTKQACTLRDTWDEFKKYNTIVLGISADSVESHKKFQEKYNLPFPLLADPEKTVIEAYDVFKKKSIFGKSFLGISRDAFLIDPEGTIVKRYNKVKPTEHAAIVLKDLAANA